jgi:hypothetical protein
MHDIVLLSSKSDKFINKNLFLLLRSNSLSKTKRHEKNKYSWRNN